MATRREMGLHKGRSIVAVFVKELHCELGRRDEGEEELVALAEVIVEGELAPAFAEADHMAVGADHDAPGRGFGAVVVLGGGVEREGDGLQVELWAVVPGEVCRNWLQDEEKNKDMLVFSIVQY